MKKILLVTLLVLCGSLIHMSADDVKVTMKNGTVFTGELKEFDPSDHVTVVVAGIETTIPISEVASVERPKANQVMAVPSTNKWGTPNYNMVNMKLRIQKSTQILSN